MRKSLNAKFEYTRKSKQKSQNYNYKMLVFKIFVNFPSKNLSCIKIFLCKTFPRYSIEALKVILK